MDHELAEFFATRLSQLPDEELVLKTSQVIAVIGLKATEDLAISTVTLTTDLRPRHKRRSAIPPNKRFLHEGFSRFNRRDLIGAIEKARINSYIGPNMSGAKTGRPFMRQGDLPRTQTPAD